MAEGLVLQEFKMALGPRASPLSLLGVHSEAGTNYMALLLGVTEQGTLSFHWSKGS